MQAAHFPVRPGALEPPRMTMPAFGAAAKVVAKNIEESKKFSASRAGWSVITTGKPGTPGDQTRARGFQNEKIIWFHPGTHCNWIAGFAGPWSARSQGGKSAAWNGWIGSGSRASNRETGDQCGSHAEANR